MLNKNVPFYQKYAEDKQPEIQYGRYRPHEIFYLVNISLKLENIIFAV